MQQAVIVGAGPGLSAAVARRLAGRGWRVHLAARTPGKLDALAAEIGGVAHGCDATDADSVAALFAAVPAPGLVMFNASARVRGPVAELEPAAVRQALMVSAFGGFVVARAAAAAMLAHGGGTIVLTGASASVKGFALSAPFAMGKFALRGLAQSMARELHPKGVHVLHVIVDGGIASAARPVPAEAPDSLLDPEAIAAAILAAVDQPRSAWSDEITLRPWVEKF
jgi:NAD(P)-dependent dehydrogenase (short-subunit alcohol dehydrogenase family)